MLLKYFWRVSKIMQHELKFGNTFSQYFRLRCTCFTCGINSALMNVSKENFVLNVHFHSVSTLSNICQYSMTPPASASMNPDPASGSQASTVILSWRDVTRWMSQGVFYTSNSKPFLRSPWPRQNNGKSPDCALNNHIVLPRRPRKRDIAGWTRNCCLWSRTILRRTSGMPSSQREVRTCPWA